MGTFLECRDHMRKPIVHPRIDNVHPSVASLGLVKSPMGLAGASGMPGSQSIYKRMSA